MQSNVSVCTEATIANGPQKLAADIASGSASGVRRGSDATFALLSQLLPHRRNRSVAFTGDAFRRSFNPSSSPTSSPRISPPPTPAARTASVMAIPIRGPKGNVTAVIEAVNNHGRTFVAEDEAVMKSLGRAAGIIMEKAHLYDQLMYTQRKTQALLKVQRASTEDVILSSLNILTRWGLFLILVVCVL
jgi:GAF domain-containing protein